MLKQKLKDLKKHKNLYAAAISLIAAAVVTFVIGGLKVTDRIDNLAQDALYQSPKALDGSIIVFGIDEKTLTDMGPYNTWDRHVMASALDALAADPEKRPAVVAIDALYLGNTDPEADAHLCAAAKELGCVVTGSFATIANAAIEDENGTLSYARNVVMEYSEPFSQLKAVTRQGHINSMLDTDGILRHSLLEVSNGQEKIYSMAYTVASAYADKNDIPVTLPKTKNGFFYVAFSAMPGGYNDGYSLSDLINGVITPDEFADKIIFIGPYAVGLQDAYFTAIDRSEQMFGVEYQANVVQQILDGNYKYEPGDMLQSVLLFAVCAVVFFVLFKGGLRLSSAVASFTVIIYIVASYLLYNMGILLHLLWIPIGVLALYLTSIAIHYVRQKAEKQRVTKTFERYVAPEIVNEILKEGTENLSLGGKMYDIAVLFVDVRGFTTMSERLKPETVVHILNRYLTMASECVEKNKGTLDKFVGDAMMAFWGAPLLQEDAVFNAVKTAVDIIEGAKRVSDELKDEIGEELRVGVGVHFGPAIVGNMGAEKHMDYTAIGDTVNTAARLEANAPGGTVYLSRAVADALEGRIECTSLGSTITLKGKTEGFEVLRLEKLL